MQGLSWKVKKGLLNLRLNGEFIFHLSYMSMLNFKMCRLKPSAQSTIDPRVLDTSLQVIFISYIGRVAIIVYLYHSLPHTNDVHSLEINIEGCCIWELAIPQFPA